MRHRDRATAAAAMALAPAPTSALLLRVDAAKSADSQRIGPLCNLLRHRGRRGCDARGRQREGESDPLYRSRPPVALTRAGGRLPSGVALPFALSVSQAQAWA